MPKPPLNLLYPYPHGRESEIESADYYEASDGKKYYMDPKYMDPNAGGFYKLQYFHFAKDIEQHIQNRRSRMTKEELELDNVARDVARSKSRNENQVTYKPSHENIYSRTDEEGNVIVPNDEPKRITHFNAGCNCFT